MQTSKYSNRLKSQTWNGNEDVIVDKKMYQCLVGKLIYVFHTRLDITSIVSVISQFMFKLKETHRLKEYSI